MFFTLSRIPFPSTATSPLSKTAQCAVSPLQKRFIDCILSFSKPFFQMDDLSCQSSKVSKSSCQRIWKESPLSQNASPLGEVACEARRRGFPFTSLRDERRESPRKATGLMLFQIFSCTPGSILSSRRKVKGTLSVSRWLTPLPWERPCASTIDEVGDIRFPATLKPFIPSTDR